MDPAPAVQPDLDTPRSRWSAVLHRIGDEVYGPGEYVGQESPMRAGEILALGTAAGVGSGTRVLDLCCGIGGPALHLAACTGCRIVGLDREPEAVAVALRRRRAAELDGRADFLAGDAVRAPVAGPFDTVLVLETLLGIEAKLELLRGVGGMLSSGGRFAFTSVTGVPLSSDERGVMPGGDGLSIVPLDGLLALLDAAGFGVTLMTEQTAEHAEVTERLTLAFLRDREAITARVGRDRWRAMAVAYQRWTAWFNSGRLQDYAIVAERRRGSGHGRLGSSGGGWLRGNGGGGWFAA